MASAAPASVANLHYALSEDDQFRLRNLRHAMLGAAVLAERNPGQDDAELGGTQLAALLWLFSDTCDRILVATPLAPPSIPIPPAP